MKIPVSSNHAFENVGPGTHAAYPIRIIDIGTQQGEYQGKVTFKRQLIVVFETPNELMTSQGNEGKPFLVSQFYGYSMHENARLRQHLETWRGKTFTDGEAADFDLKTILIKPLMISCALNEKNKLKVVGMMALPKGMVLPPPINDVVYFSLDNFDQVVFDGLSDRIKEMVMASPEYKLAIDCGVNTQSSDNPPPFGDEDIPF